jgi:hypothetical protein
MASQTVPFRTEDDKANWARGRTLTFVVLCVVDNISSQLIVRVWRNKPNTANGFKQIRLVPDPRRILRVVIAALRIWSRKQI